MGINSMVWICLFVTVHPIQAKLFPMTEGKDTNIFYLGLGEQRIDGDIWIPYQTPVDNLRYIFNWDRRALESWILSDPIAGIREAQKVSLLNTEQNCRDLLAPGTFLYRPFRYSGTLGMQRIERDGDREVVIRPADNLGQHPISHIRSCCNPEKCQEKCYINPSYEFVAFYIVDPDRKHVILRGFCKYCAIQSCVTNCPQGTFATNYINLDQVG